MAGNEAHSGRLDALLSERLGPAARVIPRRDRDLAVGLLADDEEIRSVAMGRIRERSLVTGQLFVATDARLIIAEAHRWKSSWSRVLGWTDIERLGLVDGDLVIDLGTEQLTVKTLLPVAAADQFAELHARARTGTGSTDAATADRTLVSDRLAATLQEQLPVFPGFFNDATVHRLTHELLAGESVAAAVRFGAMRTGSVVLTDRRVGRVPDRLTDASAWFLREDVTTVSLDDAAGLLLRTPDGDVEWTGLMPAEDVPTIVGRLLADNRRHGRIEAAGFDEGTASAPPPDLPDGVHRSEIDGVPVFWVDRPASSRLSAQLVVGVGQADEPFLQGQITHLLEHLVMRRFADATYDTNAAVGMGVTTFEVESRPDTVVGHLRRLCEAVCAVADGELDPGDVEAERTVLRAEADGGAGPGLALTLPAAAWFGRTGVGLVGESTLGAAGADAVDLADWCRRWFVRANAALVLDGPPPLGLTLPLPDGGRPTRPTPRARRLNTPAWTPGPPGFQVSFRAQRSIAVEVLIEALHVRWTRLLRHDKGFVYDIAVVVVGLAGPDIIVSIAADAPPDRSDRIIEALRTDLDTLRRSGFTDEQVQAAKERLAEQADDPDWLTHLAFDHAVQSLGGAVATPVVDARSAAGVTGSDVDAAWQAARSTLIVATDGPLPDFPPLIRDDTPQVSGRRWVRARRGSFVIDGSEAISGPDGVSLRWGPDDDDDWRTVRYDEVVALGIDRLAPQDAVLVLFGSSGALIGVRARDWRDGDQLVREILLAVPAHLHVYLPEDMRPFHLEEN